MKNYVVWLDSRKANILNLINSKKVLVSKSEKNHHTRHKKDQYENSNQEHYFHSLIEKLKDADHLLILGPGLTKNHFRDYIEVHSKNILAKKIIGFEVFENFEHKSEKQMIAKSLKIFKNYNLFNETL